MLGSNGKQRVPSTPLDFKDIHKAGPNELIVDYTGDGKINKIFVTDKDLNVIDITGQLIYLIQHAEAKNSTIHIENYGDVNLEELINLLYIKANSTVEMVDLGDNIRLVQKENKIDHRSLDIVNKKIQIFGFDTAEEGMIPIKMGNKLIWGKTNSTSGGVVDGSSENPTDGKIYTCITQNIVANKIYLQASIRQKTIYPQKDFKIILPKTQDEFCQIQWYVKTNSVRPEITFSNNCLWKSVLNSKLRENCSHLYKFITYDHGSTWLASNEFYQFTDRDEPIDHYVVVVDKKTN